jgi:hypothetical protein
MYLVTAGRIQVNIETSVPTCGVYPGLGPRIFIPSTGAAGATGGSIIAAETAAVPSKTFCDSQSVKFS